MRSALMMRETVRGALRVAVTLCVVASGAGAVAAQDISSPGANWSGGWGFASTNEQSLRLQSAQAMLAARNAGRTTSITNNDNRTNYQEVNVAAGGSNSADMQMGDNSSYSVGALNTGTTDITVTGDNNSVDSTIRADSEGCIDGSLAMVSSGVPNLDASFGIDISSDSSVRGVTCE